ncbi:MAG: hypothetical protein ACRD0K_10580 [Egibacteraceae bacterium]
MRPPAILGEREIIVIGSQAILGSFPEFRCLDPHGLVAKLLARRDCDRSFCAALLRAGLVDEATVLQRSTAPKQPKRSPIRTLPGHRLDSCGSLMRPAAVRGFPRSPTRSGWRGGGVLHLLNWPRWP